MENNLISKLIMNQYHGDAQAIGEENEKILFLLSNSYVLNNLDHP